MTYIGYMNGNPNFQAFNQALFAAFSLNDTSGLDYSTIATAYTEGFFVVLPIICLDERAYTYDSCLISISSQLFCSCGIDIDDNTFGGFQAMREAAALADTHNMSYVQDITIIVSTQIYSVFSVIITPYHHR